MESIAALDVPAAAVRFVDVSLQALSLCRRIGEDVQRARGHNAELAGHVENVLNALQKLKQHTLKPEAAGARITKIANDCMETSRELTIVLDRVRRSGRPGPLNTAKSTLRALNERETISKLQSRLQKRRIALDRAIVRDILPRIDLAAVAEDVQFSNLDKTVQALVCRLQNDHTTVGEQASDTKAVLGNHASAHHDRMLHSQFSPILRDSSRNLAQDHARQHNGDVIVHGTYIHNEAQSAMQTGQDANSHDTRESQSAKAFLARLWFPESTDRLSQVAEPWEDTFTWILDHQQQGDRPNFARWLQSDSPLFWISGKAGSGKSTLMKYLIQNPSAQDLIKARSGNVPLHVITFFFWRAGTDLQKSTIGLLRSLLFQILSAVPVALKQVLQKFQLLAEHPQAWNETNLSEMLRTAFSAAVTTSRLFIFIDGLDEFESNSVHGLDELLAIVGLLTKLENVKICVSSRRETQLVTGLSNWQHLQMELLNYDDIRSFAHERLKGHDDGEIYSSRIAERANGVFLWAALVTNSVLKGMEAGDDEELLISRLESVPDDLHKMLTHILAGIESCYRDSLGLYFQAMKISGDVNIARLTASQMKADVTSYKRFASDCRRTERQIISQSRGLLEISKEDYRTPKEAWYLDHENLQDETNRAALASRRILGCPDEDVLALIRYEKARVHWLHRSVYDIVFEAQHDNEFANFEKWNETATTLALLEADMRLLLAAPSWGVHCASTRFEGLLEGLAASETLDRTTVFRVLDQLYTIICAFDPEDFGHSGSYAMRWSEANPFDYDGDEKVSHELYKAQVFWTVLIDSLFANIDGCVSHILDYASSNIPKIAAIGDDGWVLANIIFELCNSTTAAAASIQSRAPFVRWSRQDVTAAEVDTGEVLLNFALEALRALGSLWEGRAVKDLHYAAAMKYPGWESSTDVSWMPLSNSTNDFFETDIVATLALCLKRWKRLGFWPRACVDCGSHCETGSNWCFIERTLFDVGSDLLRIWNTHIGFFDDHHSRIPLWRILLEGSLDAFPESSWVIPGESIEDQPRVLCNEHSASSGSVESSLRKGSLPAFRLLCKPCGAISETKPIVYNLSVTLDPVYLFLHGDSLEATQWPNDREICDALLTDVWKDPQKQLDASEQLFVLACIRNPYCKSRENYWNNRDNHVFEGQRFELSSGRFAGPRLRRVARD